MPDINTCQPTHRADAPGFRYTGRWQQGYPAVTVNSGAMLEFIFPGAQCDMLFDLTAMTQFPDLLVQVDEAEITRYRLEPSSPSIRLCPPPQAGGAAASEAAWHLLRCWTIIPSTDATQWQTLNGACKFLGVRCAQPDAEMPVLPAPASTIEFLGDSITASLRLLYTGNDWWDEQVQGRPGDWHSCPNQQYPVRNWTWQAARLLGQLAIVTGFGGQGLTTTSTTGAPPAREAFPFVYAGAPWRPAIPPAVVVIYHGTNDPAFSAAQYGDYLQTIRAAYPDAELLALCPHGRPDLAAPICSAVESAGTHIRFRDYSQGVIAPADTVDGCHLNPTGALRLAVRVANDLRW